MIIPTVVRQVWEWMDCGWVFSFYLVFKIDIENKFMVTKEEGGGIN